MIAGGFASGILLTWFSPAVSVLLVAVAAVFTHITAWICSYARTRASIVDLGRLGRATCVILLAYVAGGLRLFVGDTLPDNHIVHLTEEGGSRNVVIEGSISTHPTRRRYDLVFILQGERGLFLGQSFTTTGRLKISLRDDQRQQLLERGDRIRLNGELMLPTRRRNPGDFNYRAFLRRRGIHVEMRSSSPVVILSRASLPHLVALNRLRDHVIASLRKAVPDTDARSLCMALTAGDRTGIDEDRRLLFVDSGLMHLLAISGLHVLLVGFTSYQLLGPLLLRCIPSWGIVQLLRTLTTLLFLLIYVDISGAPVSAVRAFIMALFLLSSTLFNRPRSSLSGLGAAVLCILTIHPLSLMDAGFQLSFGAVFALLVIRPELEQLYRAHLGTLRSPGHLARATLTTVAASVGTAPALLAHFGKASLAGLILNPLAIPLAAALLLSSLAIAAISPVSFSAANCFGNTACLAARTLEHLAWLGSEHFSFLRANLVLRPIDAFSLSLILLAALASLRPSNRTRLLLAGLTCTLCAHLPVDVHSGFRHPLRVTFLDVGHGDAVLVEFPNERTMLVDTGASNSYVDHGRRTILPHFSYAGIETVDVLLLTHFDADHVGGAHSLIPALPIVRIITTPAPPRTDGAKRVLRGARRRGIAIHTVGIGDTLHIDSDVRVYVLSPDSTALLGNDSNDTSIALRILYGNSSLLLLGDVEKPVEERIVRRFGNFLRSDVIKVAHHGSATSSSVALVSASSQSGGSLAVFSSGTHRRFRLPHPSVWNRWRAFGNVTYATRSHGALEIKFQGSRLRFHKKSALSSSLYK